MNAADTRWDFADAWVFTAVGIASLPCELAELVAVADGINHAILLEDEVESALGKLSGAGLLQINDDWTFQLTEAGRGLLTRRRGNLFSQVDSVANLLALIKPVSVTVQLPAGAMANAIDEYLGRLSR
ncbi:MAG TPA: hypothetical protein VFR23_07325 [Jiangellaceae bacterium]|nr:hypothetical protein [Jiangellaceae bacterium]